MSEIFFFFYFFTVKRLTGCYLWISLKVCLKARRLTQSPVRKPDLIYTALKLSCLNYVKLDENKATVFMWRFSSFITVVYHSIPATDIILVIPASMQKPQEHIDTPEIIPLYRWLFHSATREMVQSWKLLVFEWRKVNNTKGNNFSSDSSQWRSKNKAAVPHGKI